MSGRVRHRIVRVFRGPEEPTPRVLEPKHPDIAVDHAVADALLRESLQRAHRPGPNGRCQQGDCGRPVSGNRIYCGPHAAERDSGRYEVDTT